MSELERNENEAWGAAYEVQKEEFPGCRAGGLRYGITLDRRDEEEKKWATHS